MRTYFCGVVAVSLFVLGAGTARAADLNNAAVQGGVSLSGFYTGPVGNIGSFKGKLLCLCCDLSKDPDAAKKCDAGGHHHALSVDDNSMIHPLIAGSEEAMQQINSNEMHDAEVIVTGKYYPSTGLIFVQSVRPAR